MVVSKKYPMRLRQEYVFYPCSLYEKHKKSVHQKAGAVNEDEKVLHVSDKHLSCSDDEDGEERDDAIACEGNIGAAFMDSDPDDMPVYRNIFVAMQCPWTDV
ncbi:hypothetical protein PoB_007155100 [Plakobranchus ocellatus]|uniref:Uncharacterized protein n=1 Tax=Plakobranchus ocellatus TaxID=259542 RepID=A0AAV4DMF7_9GAST|nr:hypothetical protein PoB_007155100 [Plakobranchus ocellatus]